MSELCSHYKEAKVLEAMHKLIETVALEEDGCLVSLLMVVGVLNRVVTTAVGFYDTMKFMAGYEAEIMDLRDKLLLLIEPVEGHS